MKKLGILIIFTTSICQIYGGGIDQFELSLKKDVVIGSVALSTFTTGYILKETIEPSAHDYNWNDEDFTYEYNKDIDTVSDFLIFAPLLSLPLLIDTYNKESIVTLTVLFAESSLISLGTKDIIKSLAQRSRPYNEYDSTPSEMLEDTDRYLSFPSGHTTFSFMTASFSTYVFSQGNNSISQKIALGTTTFALAGTVGYLRIISGNHHLFDVLAGAGIGSGIGFLVPFLHKKLPENITPIIGSNSVGVSILL